MKSRHAVKQGLRCLYGVVCLKLWIHYSSNLVKRQQLRERGQEPIKTEYSRQGRFQQGMLHRNGFCLKILNFPKSRAGEIAEKQHSFESRAGEIAKQAAPVNGQDERFAPLTAAARFAFRQTRRVGTACACPPAWILRFRLRLDEDGAHIRHAFAERERDGLAVVGEPVGFAALALVQQIGEQER